MQFYLLLIIATLTYSSLTAFDELSPAEVRQFQECFKINDIAPTAPATDYSALAGSLKRQNLSACQCVTFLSRYAQHEVMQEVKEQGLLSPTMFTAVQAEFERYNQEKMKNQRREDLIIYFPPSLPQRKKADVLNAFSSEFNVTTAEKDCACGAETAACAGKEGWTGIDIFESRVTLNPGTSYTIGINASFAKLKPDAARAILTHEKQHILSDHKVRHSSVKKALIFNNGSEGIKQKNISLKLMRSYEAAADRIPAACGDCSTAMDLLTWRKSYCAHTPYNVLLGLYNKAYDTLFSVDQTYKETHPSKEERAAWAERIYKLKVAEAELGKTE